jgi:hypothetical protein
MQQSLTVVSHVLNYALLLPDFGNQVQSLMLYAPHEMDSG